MSLDEAPIDCWRVKCLITGTDEQIKEQMSEYLEKYPYMCYGTRFVSKTEEGTIMQRYRTHEICAEACIHTPVAKPIGDAKEKGQHNTVFQTNHTMRA